MREIFINPETGEAWKAGTEILKKIYEKVKDFLKFYFLNGPRSLKNNLDCNVQRLHAINPFQ